jgi:hypothetical protein
MDYLNRLAATVLAGILFVITLTSLMTFLGVGTRDYQPYLYFGVAMTTLGFVLSPTPEGFQIAETT